MKSLSFALLMMAASAEEPTDLTANLRCNVDRKAQDASGNAINSDAAKVTWTPSSALMAADGSSLADAKACLDAGKAKHAEDTNKATNTYCVEYVTDSTASTSSCYMYNAAGVSEADAVVATTAYATAGDSVAAIVLTWDSTNTKSVAKTVTPTDNSASTKMTVNKGKNDADGITWSTAVNGYRPTDGTRINCPYSCQTWCSAQATADTDITKKTGLCQWVQGAVLASNDNGTGKCSWITTETTLTKDLLPQKEAAATKTAVTFSAVYQKVATPAGEWTEPAADNNTDTNTDTNTDEKKEEAGALSLAASAAALATAAFMY